ncbi:carbon monoxide dehydrogenase subunit G [Knoellia sinensis KCTC 19936]|uniref:Carbon monoxide dehydrogenase subunit G n=1 Tax=Knoellia sinensis KCTC 19936 TaxID=1385520 RepID=A0A0A0JBC8_9MICO|nr:carbon monoxide dehydrogenase subunit G [Knoellia sinensis]KGN32921.1 carbon monoxide dehydrogenase subunit G [Knoellia sinensis KCTC 19936]
MKITGTATMNASPEQVWKAVHDPAVLARSVPGCQSLRELSPGRYAMTVMAGVAAIKGSYEGEVAITDVTEPTAFTMKADGAGAPGTISTTVDVALAPGDGGGTAISYEADAVVGGPVGGVGQRMLAGVARKMAGQMFQALDADIAGDSRPELTPSSAPARTEVTQLDGSARDDAAAGGRHTGVSRTELTQLGSSERVYAGSAGSAAGGGSSGPGFVPGALFGAAIALAGVVVGWLVGGR